MGQVLEALHRLQAVERQLAEIRRNRNTKVRRVEYHKRQVKEAEEKIQKNELIIRQRQVRLDALQLDVASREETINKHRQALNTAKTNKEYAAILTAMNTEKADNAKFETEILHLMDEIQRLTDEAATLQAKRAKLEENVTRAEEILHTLDAETKAERDELQAKRDVCAEQLEPTTLITFTRVADRHDGEALVPLTRLHPKRDEYICSGCNLKVTLEVVNSLQTRDEVQFCTVCGRILYLDTPSKQRAGA